MIVHVLEVIDGDRELSSCRAITPLTAGDENLHLAICVGIVVDAGENVALRERALGSVRRFLAQGVGNDERAVVRIERAGALFGIRPFTAGTSACTRGATGGSGRCGCIAFCSDLRLYFIGDCLLDFRRKRYSSASLRRAACIVAFHFRIRGRCIRCGLCAGLGGSLIRGLQVGGDQIVREPERRIRIYRVWVEIVAVEAVPRSRPPSPREDDGSGPRIVGPAIKARAPIVAGDVAIVVAATPAVTSVNVYVGAIVVHIRSAVIVAPTTPAEAVLDVPAAAARGDNARTIAAHAGNTSRATRTMRDRRVALVNRADFSVGTEMSGSATLGVDARHFAGLVVIHGVTLCVGNTLPASRRLRAAGARIARASAGCSALCAASSRCRLGAARTSRAR